MVPLTILPRGHAEWSHTRSEINFPPGALRTDESGIFVLQYRNLGDKLGDMFSSWTGPFENLFWTSRGEAEIAKAAFEAKYAIAFRVVKLNPAENKSNNKV